MSVMLHRQAEALMAEAELLVAKGCHPEARKRWLEAARFEAAAFEQIPRDRGKTRGIIAVSAVALFRDAGAFDEALRHADRYLMTGDLPDAWRAELAALVHATALQAGLEKAQLTSAQDRNALYELIALFVQYTGAEVTQDVLEKFLVDLTVEVGALPRLSEVVEAVKLANGIEVAQVGKAMHQLVRQRRPSPASATATAEDAPRGAARPPVPNPASQNSAQSSSTTEIRPVS
jgi:hypothetical protein